MSIRRADYKSRRNASRMRTAGEGGLSPVFASRAAVPRPVAVDYKTCWFDENVTCFKTGIAENRGIVLQSIPSNGSLWRGAMGKLAGHRNTCERDVFRNRTCTAVQGRFYNPPGSQVGIGRVTCAQYGLQNTLIVNYLNVFISHMFYM